MIIEIVLKGEEGGRGNKFSSEMKTAGREREKKKEKKKDISKARLSSYMHCQ